MIRTTGFATALMALALAAPVHAQDSAPMTAQDLVTMPRLGAPAASPDGRWAVYSVTETDPETYEKTSTLWLRDLADAGARAMKLDLGGSASGATFGVDGALYFLSDRAGEGGKGLTQVWRVDLNAQGKPGKPTQVSRVAGDVAGFALSPRGNRIALFGDMPRTCITFGCEAPAAHLPGPGDGRLYRAQQGFVRHWDTWETPGSYSRVFAYDLVGGKATGEGIALDGPAGEGALVGDTPTKPFGGGEEIAWAPDGSGIYFAARRADHDEPQSTNIDIWWNGLAGKEPIDLTYGNEATDTLPAPSPDGKWLAYAAMARPRYESDKLTVMLRDVASGETRALTTDWDRSVGSLAWTPDSRWIVVTAGDTLDTPAFRIDPASGAVEKLDLMAGNEAHIGNVVPLPGERLLFTRDSIGAPPELFLSQGWQQAMPLTEVAGPELGRLAPIVTRRLSFKGANGDTVWGQITKLDRAGGRMPAILYVHGGPQGSFNDGWSSRWNPRVVASQGYAVVSVDFHGSTGYGQAFTDAINRDWGGKPLEDLQKGFAAALASDPQIDGKHACAMGASYGGYMMNWIAGKWPDRFDCLVQHDGIFDMRSFYYGTEERWFPKWDFGGSYAENAALYEKWNPVNHVDAWTTPMLVITGEKDFRIPSTQALGAYAALQERGVPAELLVFPEENHWVLDAKDSLQWHQTVFAWLDRWLHDK